MTIPALLSQQAKLQRAVKNAATTTDKINLLKQLSTVNDALSAALKK